MTIYAIVNNLLSEKDSQNDKHPVWTIISQSGILQGGNPFFVPDFAGHFEARTALAIKIGKLGKGIAPRFAGRYIEEAAPAILFVATDLLKHLQQNGLPWTPAISYDRCLAIGKFWNIQSEGNHRRYDISLVLESSGSSIDSKWDSDSIDLTIEETISVLSRDNTIKTGDIILFGISGSGPEVRPDMRAHLSLNGIDTLAFNIR